MKTNDRKMLQLINHGFSGSLLSDLNENQINALHNRLIESITTKDPKKALELTKMDPNVDVQLTTEVDDVDVIEDPEATADGMDMMEKFESKKQQKYFFAKCGDGKTKEQKKWCKMAEEFAEKTNFKKLPEKKQETKEGYMDMLGKAMNNNMKNKVNDITPSFSMGENELEKSIMRLVEKHISPRISKKEFLSLVSEPKSKENKK